MNEFIVDKNKLPLEGKNSRMGHYQQIMNKSVHLSKLERKAEREGFGKL